MRTTEITTYDFAELSEEAQVRALNEYRDSNVQDEYWHEGTVDDAKEIGKLLGIEIKDVYFSGFSSQGDGACFTGRYEYAKNSVKAVKSYAPQDTVLHNIAVGLYNVQKTRFYSLWASVTHRGHYSHENCTEITVEDGDGYAAIPSDDITELLRDFMRWIYARLEEEYEYQTSDEAVKESIIANEVQFDSID